MPTAALLVSIISALIALTTLGLSWKWRRDLHFSVITGFRALVASKQVFVDSELMSWSIDGLQGSVYDLREGLTRNLPSLPRSAVPVGEAMLSAVVRYLSDLRPVAFDPAAKTGLAGEHQEVLHRHRKWQEEMREHLAALQRLR